MADWTEFPTCPHCGFVDQDWWDGLDEQVNDGSRWGTVCGTCGRAYEVAACVDITFSTRTPDTEGES